MIRNRILGLSLAAPVLALAGSGGSEILHGDFTARDAVQVRYQYDPDGKPHEVAILKSSGYRELDRAALAAAKFWMRAPAKPRDMDASEHGRGRSS